MSSRATGQGALYSDSAMCVCVCVCVHVRACACVRVSVYDRIMYSVNVVLTQRYSEVRSGTRRRGEITGVEKQHCSFS